MTGDEVMHASERVHTRYAEAEPPPGCSDVSPLICHRDRAAAARFITEIDRAAGPEAAARRTWTMDACTCASPATGSARYVRIA